MMKKLLSILLVTTLLLTCIPMGAVSVSAAYENTWKNTGDQARDIIGVAQTQLGYTEGSNNSNKYSAAFNHNNVEWCAYFISWCAKEAGISESIINRQGIASPFSGYFNIPNTHGKSDYFPKPGDLVFYGPNSKGDHYHVGLVETVNKSTGYITTIEGNTNSSGSSTGNIVYRHTRHYQYSSICCYGTPNYTGGTHTCNKGQYVYYEAAHPHYSCYKCSICGDVWRNKDEKNSVNTCSSCWKITFDLSQTSVAVKVGESKTISCVIGGVWPSTQTNLIDWDKDLFNIGVETGKITITGKKKGSGSIRMYMWSDSSKNTLIGSKSISVTVNCNHSYSVATCTKPVTCALCGATSGSALGHTYTNACDTSCNTCSETRTVTHKYTAATCTLPKKCSICGKTSGSALGHVYTNACDTNCDTCGATRSIKHTYDSVCDAVCNICGYTRTAKAHDYHEKIPTQATCGTAGERLYICKECDYSYTVTIPATGMHSYTNDCDTSCDICGYTRTAKAHDYREKTSKEATCGTAGECVYVCKPCGYSYTVTIPATGMHSYTNDCDTSCNTCGATRTIKHDYKAATCTAPKTCEVCKATTGNALGHKWNSGKVTKAATCAKTGVKTYTCSVCKVTKTETIAKIKTHKYTNACDTSCNTCKATRKITHSYKTVTKAATATANGYTVKRCSVCKAETGKTTIYKASTIKLSETAYVYNGKAVKPSVTIKDSKGKKIATSNYTVTYASGRKNVGTYKVTIKFKGKYSGTKTLTYKINPAGTTVKTLTAGSKKLTVAITKKTAQVSGYEIQYSTGKSFKTYKSKTLTKTGLTLTGLKAKTTYYVRVRTYKVVNGKKVYSAWSAVKSKKTK